MSDDLLLYAVGDIAPEKKTQFQFLIMLKQLLKRVI